MVKTSGVGEAEELPSSTLPDEGVMLKTVVVVRLKSSPSSLTIPGESVMVKTSGGGEAEELLLLPEQEQDQQSLPPHPSVSQLEPVQHHHFLHKI
jgi:hypothetical protein